MRFIINSANRRVLNESYLDSLGRAGIKIHQVSFDFVLKLPNEEKTQIQTIEYNAVHISSPEELIRLSQSIDCELAVSTAKDYNLGYELVPALVRIRSLNNPVEGLPVITVIDDYLF